MAHATLGRSSDAATTMPATLDFTTPHLLQDEEQYQAAVQAIDQLLDAEVREHTREWELLRFLSVLVKAYEDEAYPQDEYLAGGTPQSAVDFMLKQHDMTRADLEPSLGGKSRVSEFFAGKRALSKQQIAALHVQLGIPLELLFET